MTTNMSNYLEQQVLGHTLLGSTFTAPSTVWLSLATSVTSDGDQFTEVATNTAYARIPIDFSEPTSGPGYTVANSALLSFSAATTAWGTVTHVGIHDSATIGGGNLLYWGAVTTPQVVSTGNQLQMSAGELTVTLG